MKKSQSKGNLRKSNSDENFAKKDKDESLEKDDKNKNKDKEVLPKNINNYKHLIDTLLLTGKDIEWVLQLRGYKKFRIGEKDEGGKGGLAPPSFFQRDYDHYLETKEKLNKGAKLALWNHTGNSNNFEHLMSKRVGEKSNPSLLGYETNLRIFPPKCTLKGPKADWSPPPNNIQRSNTNLPRFLPPLLKTSEKNLEKINNLVTRPLDHIYQEDMAIDGKGKVKNRRFLKSKETLGLIGENNSMKPYNLSYSIKNINNFKHFFNDSNNSYAVWGTELRNHPMVGKGGKKERNGSFEIGDRSPSKAENLVRKERRDRIERHFHLK